jgi:hypothetical protein
MRPEEPVHEHVEPRLEEQEQEGAQKIRHDDSLRASPRRSRRERGAPARPNASDLREVPGASVNARVYPARSRRPSCASPSADVHAELASFLQQHRNRRFRGTAYRGATRSEKTQERGSWRRRVAFDALRKLARGGGARLSQSIARP